MRQIFYQLIYNGLINKGLRSVNKLLSPVVPSVRIPPSGTIIVRHRYGRFRIKTNQTNFLTYLVYWNGYLNFEYTSIFIPLIQKINTFIDIGANIGYYSFLAASVNPAVKVYSFEPAKGPHYYFQKNLKANPFTNIKLESDAVSDKTGQITFYEIKNKKYKYLRHNLAGESNAGSMTTGRNFEINTVSSITLDDYIKSNGISSVQLIKMDTEGTEDTILQGAHNVLTEMKPIIICETIFNTIEDKLERILRKYDYRFFNHTEKGLKKVETIIRDADDGVKNCFFVHASMTHLIQEYLIR